MNEQRDDDKAPRVKLELATVADKLGFMHVRLDLDMIMPMGEALDLLRFLSVVRAGVARSLKDDLKD